MIYLKSKDIPLKYAFNDVLVEEKNGRFDLEFEYPMIDDVYKEFKKFDIVTCNTPKLNFQDFYITDIQKTNKGVKVFAKHIFFLTSKLFCRSVQIKDGSCSSLFRSLKGSVLDRNDFTFYSDIADVHTFRVENKSLYDVLLDSDFSVVKLWQGTFLRDNYSVKLLARRGVDTEYIVAKRKNIAELSVKETSDFVVTRVYLRAKKRVDKKNENEQEQWLETVVDSPLIEKYPFIFSQYREYTDSFRDVDALRKYGENLFSHFRIDLPKETFTLKCTDEINSYNLDINDTVLIYYEDFNIHKKIEVTKYSYSPMNSRYLELTFGYRTKSLADTLTLDTNKKIEETRKQVDKLADENRNAISSLTYAVEEKIKDSNNLVNESIEEKIRNVLSTVSSLRDSLTERINNINTDIDTETVKALSNAEIKAHLQSAEGKQKLIESITADVTWLNSVIVNTELLNAIVANIDLARIKRLIVDTAFIESILSKEEFVQQFENRGVSVVNIFSKLKDSITQSIQTVIDDKDSNLKTELISLFEQKSNELRSSISSVNTTLSAKSVEIEKKISSVTQRADEIDLRVSSIKVGGVNLCKDSEFTNSNLWFPWALRDKTVSKISSGTRFRFENLDSSKGTVSCYYNLKDISFLEDKEYVVSFYVKNFRGYPITFYLSGFKDISRFSLKGYEDTRVVVSGVKTDATNSQLMVVMDSRSTGLDFAVSKLMVEEGNVATSWSVHPDEKVDVNRVVTAINLSDEIAKIGAERIELNGDVVINAINGTSTKISGDKIKAGTIQGSTISGGEILGGNITGSNIRGNYSLLIGNSGYIRPYEDGVLFKVPEEEGSTNGVGVTIKGNGTDSGITIFESRDIFGNATISPTFAKTLLTVGGEINGAFRRNDNAFFGKAVMSNQYKNFPIKASNDTSKYAYYRVSWIGLFTNANDGSYNLRFDDGTGSTSLFDIRANATSSDRKLKKNIRLCEKRALDVVGDLKFYSFDWKEDKNGFRKKHTSIGVIAQDLQKIDDSFVYESSNGLCVDDFRLLNVALKSIQELQEENKALKDKNKEILKRLERLEILCGV